MGKSQSLPRIGLPRDAAGPRVAQARSILEANADKLPSLWLPASHREDRRLLTFEERERLSRRLIDPRTESGAPPRRQGIAKNISLIDKLSVTSPPLSKDRKNCQALALLGDRKFVEKILLESEEPREQREAREKLLDNHRWAMVFAPVPPRPDLLPTVFRGTLPSVVTLKADWSEERSSPCSTQRGMKFRKSSRSWAADDEDKSSTRHLSFEHGDRLTKLCRKLADTVLQPEERIVVLTRGVFCRLILALSGLPHFDGKRTCLMRAARRFDELAEAIPLRATDGSVEGNVHGFLLPATSAGMGSPSATATMMAPALIEMPIFKLWKQLLSDMVDDIVQVSGPHADLETVVFRAHQQFFEKLTPEAEQYVVDRANLVKRRMHPARREGNSEEILDSVGDPSKLSPKALQFQDERGHPSTTPSKFSPKMSPKISPAQSPNNADRSPSKLPPSKQASNDFSDIADPADMPSIGSNPAHANGPPLPQGLVTMYASPSFVLKGEALASQLMEPEVIHFMSEFRELFGLLFNTYRDVPTDAMGAGGHMTLNAFLRFCGDFGLFPKYANFQTVQWLYHTAEGYTDNSEQKMCGKLAEKRRSHSKSAGKSASARRQRDRDSKRRRRSSIEPISNFLYCGKWLSNHLQWITKDLADLTEIENLTYHLLGAIDEWLEDVRLTVSELFHYVDIDGNDLIDKDEFRLAVNFMGFQDSPTSEQIDDIFSLLAPPGDEMLEVPTLEKATRAVAKRRETLNLAGNLFAKEWRRMTQPESNAFIFFGELFKCMERKKKTARELFEDMDHKRKGRMDAALLTKQAHQIIQTMDRGSPALGIGNPFNLLDLNGDGVVSIDEFCEVIEKVEEAKKLREMKVVDEKHPIFLSARAEPPAQSRQWIFGRGAFMECLLKIAFQHLGYHGTSEQGAQPSLSKALWLLLFLHWHFDTAKDLKSPVPVKSAAPEAQKPLSPATEAAPEAQRLPVHVPPLRRLVQHHPSLFLDHPTAPPCSVLPATSLRPETAPCGAQQCGGAQPQHNWGSASCAKCCQADTVVHALLGSAPPVAQGLLSLDRVLLAMIVG